MVYFILHVVKIVTRSAEQELAAYINMLMLLMADIKFGKRWIGSFSASFGVFIQHRAVDYITMNILKDILT